MENFSIPETMKAMTLVAYDKLQLATVPVPKPGPGEVLCRIKSVAICGSDPKMIHGDYAWTNWPPYYPFIMGHEWAGQIVALGEGVNDFKVGDRVAGEAHVGCGKCDNCKKGHYTVCLNYGKDGHDGGLDMGHRHYGFYWQGANAEYNVYKTSALHIIPDNVSYDVAAMTDCAGVAFHGVEMAGVTPAAPALSSAPAPLVCAPCRSARHWALPALSSLSRRQAGKGPRTGRGCLHRLRERGFRPACSGADQRHRCG